MGFDASRDAAVDTVDSAAALPSLCGIPGGQWQLSPPVMLDDVNGLLIAANPGEDRSEFDPVFSPSGLELFVTSDQARNWDIWIAARTAVDAPFTTLARSPVSTPGVEFGYQPVPAADAAVICADFDGGPDLDYYYGVGLTTGPTWTRSMLSTAMGDSDARLSPSGLEVYLVRGDQNDDSRDIYIASRTTVTDDFGAARPVGELNSDASDASPVPVGDLEILFASQRTASLQTDDIYLASRATPTEPFGPAIRLDELRSDFFDGEPAVHVTTDGCEIVFVSNRSGIFNLYRSTVVRR